jgi:CRP-like cAMP-binding protein
MQAASPKTWINNRLIAALPRSDFDRLAPYLEQVDLPKKKVLYDAGEVVRHAYFVQSGMVSLFATTSEGEAIEVGAVGYEGMVGIPTVLPDNRAPLRTMVQIAGGALRIEARALRREFNQCERLRELLLGHTHALAMQIAQLIACNRYHPTEERLARWLLMARDRVRSDTFDLTHEFISCMLGTTRSGVSTVAGALQDEGLIRYRRGRITILDGKGLEAKSCACYRTIRENGEGFLAA